MRNLRHECPAPKHYYAVQSPYGIYTVYNRYNPPIIFVFCDKQTRDKFVQQKPEYRENITRKEADRLTYDYERLYVYPDGYILDAWGVTLKTDQDTDISDDAWERWDYRRYTYGPSKINKI